MQRPRQSSSAPWGAERRRPAPARRGRRVRAGAAGGRPQSIDLGAAIDFARALTLVDIGDREQVRGGRRRRSSSAGATTARSYDAVFDRWWRQRSSATCRRVPAAPAPRRPGRRRRGRIRRGRWRCPEQETAGPAPDRRARDPDPVADRRGARRRGADRRRRHRAGRLQPGRGPAPPRLRPDDARRSCARPSGWSTCSCRASSGAGRAATSSTRHGRRLAPRAMFRRNLGTGGQLLDVGLAAARSTSRARSSSCATSPARWSATRGCCSGSSRRCPPSTAVQTEAFVFGTRLTRVTRLLRDRDRDRALARVADVGERLGRRHADRGVVPRVQPALGAADAAHVGRRDRRLGRLGPRRPGARGHRDGAPAAQLPPAGLAQPAGRARPATSRWPAGCGPRFPTSTTSCRPARSPASSGSARSSPASAPGDTRRGSEAAAHAALPTAPDPAAVAVPAALGGAHGRSTGCAAADELGHDRGRPSPEDDPMQELLETLDTWRADRRRARPSGGRSSCGRSGRRRDRRAPCSCTRTTAGSPDR